MDERENPVSYTRIKIRMERPFHEFGRQEQDDFFDDLARVSGMPKTDFREIKLRMGCVIFEADLDSEAAARLLELFDKRNMDSHSPEMEEFTWWPEIAG